MFEWARGREFPDPGWEELIGRVLCWVVREDFFFPLWKVMYLEEFMAREYRGLWYSSMCDSLVLSVALTSFLSYVFLALRRLAIAALDQAS